MSHGTASDETVRGHYQQPMYNVTLWRCHSVEQNGGRCLIEIHEEVKEMKEQIWGKTKVESTAKC